MNALGCEPVSGCSAGLVSLAVIWCQQALAPTMGHSCSLQAFWLAWFSGLPEAAVLVNFFVHLAALPGCAVHSGAQPVGQACRLSNLPHVCRRWGG